MATPRADDKPDAAAAWAARADELARWAWDRLVVRHDCWGAYTAPEQRGRPYTRKDGTPARVPQSYTAKGELTLAALVRHFRGERPEHVLGGHSTSTTNTCIVARVDIDAHGPAGNDPAANLRAALAWYDRLAGLGAHPLLYTSNGKGGYHLGTLFSEPVPAPLTFAFLRWLTGDHAQYGLPVRPEVFPKQPRIPEGGYGNWLRLVGRHHTRPHWPEVWDGRRWLSGSEAVAFILALTGDPPSLILAEVSAAPPRPSPPRAHYPAWPGDNVSRRIAAYLRRLPNLGEGQGRDDVAYSFACWLTRDMALPDDTALEWLRRWDAGNNPPKGEEALRKVVAIAKQYGVRPVGCGRETRGGRSGVSVQAAGRPGHYVFRATIEVP
jgi:hypothetical protein